MSMETGFTIAELDRMIPAQLAAAREQRHRRSVRFDPARRVIDVAGYQLDLDEARNAADPQCLRDLFRELDEACRTVFGKGIQGVYCPWGEARMVDWRRGVTRPARLDEASGTKQKPSEDAPMTAPPGGRKRAARAGR